MAQPVELMLIMVIFSRLWPRFSDIQSNLEQLGYIIPSLKAVVVIDQGKIIQIGEYNQLAREKRGLFSSLLDNQIKTIV